MIRANFTKKSIAIVLFFGVAAVSLPFGLFRVFAKMDAVVPDAVYLRSSVGHNVLHDFDIVGVTGSADRNAYLFLLTLRKGKGGESPVMQVIERRLEDEYLKVEPWVWKLNGTVLVLSLRDEDSLYIGIGPLSQTKWLKNQLKFSREALAEFE